MLDDEIGTYNLRGDTYRTDVRAAGQDATEQFFGLHRYEVLEKPQYARLQIGVIEGEEPQMEAHKPGALSKVPYAEPTWLSEGFRSPYYKEVRAFTISTSITS